MRTAIIASFAVVLAAFSASPGAAQQLSIAPQQGVGGQIPASLGAAQQLSIAPQQGLGGQMLASQAPAPGPIDANRLQLISIERTRQVIFGVGLVAAGGAVGLSKQNWPVDEGVVGIAIAALGIVTIIEPVMWGDLEVRGSANGLSLAW